MAVLIAPTLRQTGVYGPFQFTPASTPSQFNVQLDIPNSTEYLNINNSIGILAEHLENGNWITLATFKWTGGPSAPKGKPANSMPTTLIPNPDHAMRVTFDVVGPLTVGLSLV